MTRLGDAVTGWAIDLPGCGTNGPVTGPERCTIPAYADDVAALIAAAGLTRPVLIGHSLGGATALRLALDRPEAVGALVLVNPASTTGLDFVPAEMFDALAHPSPEQQDVLARAAFHRPPPDDDWSRLTAVLRQATPGHIEGPARSMRDFVVIDRLSELDMPALLIAGDRDRHVPLRNHLATAKAIPRCGLQVFYDVGHVPFVEVPEPFDDVVRRFLAATRG